MSGTPTHPEGPTLENAKARLREIMSASTMIHDGASLYLQQIAQAGLLALDALLSRPEEHQLAENMAQQVDDVCSSLQIVAHIDEELENDLLEFLGAINQIQDRVPALTDSTIITPFAALGKNIQELSAQIVWHILANENSEMGAATEKEADDAPLSQALPSQATNDNHSSSVPDVCDNPNCLLGVDPREPNNDDTSSQSATADMLMALRLHLEELTGTTMAGTIPTNQVPNPSSSAGLSARGPNIRHHGQTLDFEEAHGRGIDLLNLFERDGDLRNLSNGVSLLRESLLLCPLNPWQRVGAIGNLAVALKTQYRQTGALSDLNEAIALSYEALEICPSGHPQRATILNNLSNALFTRYQRDGSISDLAEVISKDREALSLRPFGHPDRAESLNSLSTALFNRYQREGRLSDLAEAIEQDREAVNLCPPGHPDRAVSLSNLSTALMVRYEHEGSLPDLTEAIEQNRKALNLCPPGHPARALSLNSLSNALLIRYQREGSLSDLAEAIKQYQEALDLRPPGHPSRIGSLNNLSSALLTRYRRKGSLSDLTEAIERYQEALNLHTPGHPGRALSLSNLSTALFTRYQSEGSLSDLAEAIEQDREALSLRPPGQPDRVVSLNNLSHALVARYQREGNLSDLAEAIEQFREALNLCLPGHPDHAVSLGNLSVVLMIRYQREGSLSDLTEAIEKSRKSLDLRPPGHPNRALSLDNLSNALLSRYRREASLSELAEVIEQKREALHLRPPGHPSRTLSLNNLSTVLMVRYQHDRNHSDLTDMIELDREAVDLCPPDHPERATFLSGLSDTLLSRYQCEGNPSDLVEVMELKQEVLNLRPSGHPGRSQALCSLSHALLHTIVGTTDNSAVQDHQTSANKVFEMLREAATLPDCPPRDRLQAALQWINESRRLASEPMFDAYSTALDQQDIVLATSNTIENKHSQLTSSDGLAQSRRLGVEAASYAVRQGYMTLAVEFLERGRNLLFGQIGRYRVDLEALRTVNTELAHRFSDLSSLLEASVVSDQSMLEGQTVFKDPTERYRKVASDWSRTVEEIRALEGFDRFLKSPKYAALRAVAAEGPVIIVIPSDDQSDALIISQERDAPHHVALPEAGTEKLVELGNALIQAVLSDDGFATEKSVKKILRSLWDLIVGPIAEALEKELHIPFHSRIWWCPTSFFSFLPLHAAGRYTSNSTNENIPDRYVSSYTPTLYALLRARRHRSTSQGENMLILAQPDTPGQSQLPNAQIEAELVKKVVEPEMALTLISGKEGTHTAILDAMVKHSWLHLTCHGFQDFANPFQSCFCLYDGQLTLHDIMRRGLPDAKFAFLAACHTATGDHKLLDEGLHLASGLQFAGFKSVVGTIWEVADIDGPVLAEAFYGALQLERPGEGMDCGRAAYALSKAVKHLRDNGVPISRRMRFIHIGI